MWSALNYKWTETNVLLEITWGRLSIRHNKKDGGMSILKTLILKFKLVAKTLKII